MASFPTSIKTFTTKVDGVTDVLAEHVNSIQDEVNAIETELLPMLGGWLRDAVTWVRTTNTTFTRAGATSDLFPMGCKLRWKENGGAYRYAYGIGVSGTTITIVGNTITAGAAISDMAVSYACIPQGYPDWLAWSPTLVGWSTPPPTNQYRFKITGRMVTIAVYQAGASVSNSTAVTMTAPVIPAGTGYYGTVMWSWRDNGVVGTVPGRVYIAPTTGIITCNTNMGSGTWTASGSKEVDFTLNYEI